MVRTQAELLFLKALHFPAPPPFKDKATTQFPIFRSQSKRWNRQMLQKCTDGGDSISICQKCSPVKPNFSAGKRKEMEQNRENTGMKNLLKVKFPEFDHGSNQFVGQWVGFVIVCQSASCLCFSSSSLKEFNNVAYLQAKKDCSLVVPKKTMPSPFKLKKGLFHSLECFHVTFSSAVEFSS